jgi:hypothetical protein
MFNINARQMASLEASRLREFEDRTCAHLAASFPRHRQLLGEEPVREVVRLGWAKAQGHALTAECCVRSFIEFMCRLGSGFDTDPLLPWAGRILEDRAPYTEIERGDRLYHQAYNYIAHISADYRDAEGKPTTSRFVQGLRDLRSGRTQVLTEASYPNFSVALIAQLQSTFPAKCAYVGEARVAAMVPHSVRVARSFGITTERGITLFAILLFVLGDGFANDPLLPWARAVLGDARIVDQNERVDRLLAEGVGFLRRWWDSSPPGAA